MGESERKQVVQITTKTKIHFMGLLQELFQLMISSIHLCELRAEMTLKE
jgi:hypothetical protein